MLRSNQDLRKPEPRGSKSVFGISFMLILCVLATTALPSTHGVGTSSKQDSVKEHPAVGLANELIEQYKNLQKGQRTLTYLRCSLPEGTNMHLEAATVEQPTSLHQRTLTVNVVVKDSPISNDSKCFVLGMGDGADPVAVGRQIRKVFTAGGFHTEHTLFAPVGVSRGGGYMVKLFSPSKKLADGVYTFTGSFYNSLITGKRGGIFCLENIGFDGHVAIQLCSPQSVPASNVLWVKVPSLEELREKERKKLRGLKGHP